jgi:putative transposase
MSKCHHVAHGLSGWILAILNGLLRRPLHPIRGSVVLTSVTDLSRNKADLIADAKRALLRQQLAILKRQTKHPHLTTADRLHLLFFSRIVKTWQQVLLIVQPVTLLRWHRKGFQLFWQLKSKAGRGRQQIPDDTIELIRRMARENPLWVAERIWGELLKLGIHVGKRTIQRYMREERPDHLASQSWATFLKTHAKDVWSCDFIPVIDLLFRQLYIFFVVELATRRVPCGPPTPVEPTSGQIIAFPVVPSCASTLQPLAESMRIRAASAR